jgi:hypothetical protein
MTVSTRAPTPASDRGSNANHERIKLSVGNGFSRGLRRSGEAPWEGSAQARLRGCGRRAGDVFQLDPLRYAEIALAALLRREAA